MIFKRIAIREGRVRPFFFAATAAVCLVLAACGGGGGGSAGGGGDLALAASVVLDPMNPDNWEIGPVVNGRSYSLGMPLHPAPHPDGKSAGWIIDLPAAPGSVNYVTMPTGSLAGRTKITMHYRIEAAPGVQVQPRNFPDNPSKLTLYFQRSGDDWSAQAGYEAYRWYAAFSTESPIRTTPEERIIEARFDGNWLAVLGSTRENNPAGFEQALREAGRVGFVLGGGDGLGHGVNATGPARLVVTSFHVE